MEINIVLMGQRIRATRKEKNISSDYLAEKVGLVSIYRVKLRGSRKNVDIQRKKHRCSVYSKTVGSGFKS